MTDSRLPVVDVRTPYAPSPRAVADQVRRDVERFASQAGLVNLLNAIPALLLVLNPQRQVIFANRSVLQLLELDTPAALYGLRPGEVFDCAHAVEQGGGCGLSDACRECGAARAIYDCERGTASVQECRITQHRSGKALDLRVATTPFDLDGETYTVLALTDISHEKRRHALERIFLHDLLNTVNGMMAYTELLRMDGRGNNGELGASLHQLISEMAHEIHAQRQLLAAENNDLVVRFEQVSSRQAIDDVVRNASGYASGSVEHPGALRIDPSTQDVAFPCDRTLLGRILGNLIRNAMEASGPGQVVTIGAAAGEDAVEFFVHNAGVMPEEVQLQIFQRSFSTKGPGRGLGTYSVKLLAERYLSGRVWFTSDEQTGTTFHVAFPRQR